MGIYVGGACLVEGNVLLIVRINCDGKVDLVFNLFPFNKPIAFPLLGQRPPQSQSGLVNVTCLRFSFI